MADASRRLSFGANADAYERARPAWPAASARWLVPGEPRLVVELGAGTGKLTRALAELGSTVVAVEPDERMLAALRDSGGEGVHGSAEAIPLADGEADAVVAGSSFHWLDLGPALAEIHRVLRPGGTLGFGWNHRDGTEPGMARVAAAIEAARDERSTWPTTPWPELITASGLFRDVERSRFEHVLELPRDALADHLRSYASLAQLPQADQDRLRDLVGWIVDEEPSLHRGGMLTLPFAVDAFRAVRA